MSDKKPSNKQQIAVVVNGTPVLIDVNTNAPLKTIVGKALELSGSAGQSEENWELRDAAGNELDVSRKIESFAFPDDVRLFLNLKAGVGGGL